VSELLFCSLLYRGKHALPRSVQMVQILCVSSIHLDIASSKECAVLERALDIRDSASPGWQYAAASHSGSVHGTSMSATT